MKNTSQIGKREERQICKDLEALGYSARRQPGSGNRAFDLQHDVYWRDSPVGPLHIEDKYRDESRWKTLEKWKEGADILTVRQARGERMAFLSWKLLLELIGQNEGYSADSTGKYGAVRLADGSWAYGTGPVKESQPKRKIPSRSLRRNS